MRTIYIDSDCKCHTVNDGTMIAIETDSFDGKCDAFVEGYRFVPSDKIWVREDGEVFEGEMITPWKDFYELDEIQREHERQLLEERTAELAELDALVLELQYNTLVV